MASRGCRCASEVDLAAGCAREVEDAAARLRGHFRRPEAWDHARDYLRGLLAEVERKNGWQLAERAGYGHPRGIQRVLDRYLWDAEAVRDDLRRTSWRTWATRGRCWWSTRPASPSKGRTRRGWPGSTAGRWASGPTARWGSSWVRRPQGARRAGPGPLPPAGVDRRPPPLPGGGHPRRGALPHQAPAGPGDGRAGAGRGGAGGLGRRRRGVRQRRQVPPRLGGARPSLRRRRAPRLPRLDLAALRPAGPLDGHGGAGRGAGGGGHGLGPPELRGGRPRAPRVRLGLLPRAAGGAGRGGLGARRARPPPPPAPRTRSPTTWSTPPPAPPSRRSSARPARGGRSRTPSSRPRGWWGSTTTRSAAGGAGTATSRWPCWPSPP